MVGCSENITCCWLGGCCNTGSRSLWIPGMMCVLGCAKMSLIYILILIMLYSLVTINLWGLLLVEAMNLQTLENNISEVLCPSRQQYRDYIIGSYGVKHSTVSNSKCAMSSLSCLLSFYTIPISPIL